MQLFGHLTCAIIIRSNCTQTISIYCYPIKLAVIVFFTALTLYTPRAMIAAIANLYPCRDSGVTIILALPGADPEIYERGA